MSSNSLLKQAEEMQKGFSTSQRCALALHAATRPLTTATFKQKKHPAVAFACAFRFNLATNFPLTQLSCSKRSARAESECLLLPWMPSFCRMCDVLRHPRLPSHLASPHPPPLAGAAASFTSGSAPHPSFSIPSSRLTRAAADAVRRANLQSRLRRSAYSARVRQVFRASNLIATAVEPCCSTRASACAA